MTLLHYSSIDLRKDCGVETLALWYMFLTLQINIRKDSWSSLWMNQEMYKLKQTSLILLRL